MSIVVCIAGLMLVGCGSPGHTVEGKYYGGTRANLKPQCSFTAKRSTQQTQKIPRLPTSKKKLAVCYGTPDELKNLSDAAGDPVKGEIFSIIAEGLTKAVASSGIFTAIDTVPSSITLRECEERGDDLLLNLTPHAAGVGELYNCRTGDKNIIAGQSMTEMTQAGSIEALKSASLGKYRSSYKKKLAR